MNFRFNTKRGRPRRKPPSMHTPLIGSAGRIDDPPPLDSPDNGDILYLRPGHLERITVENDEIGYLAGRYRTPVVLLSVLSGSVDGHHRQISPLRCASHHCHRQPSRLR